MSDDVIDDEGRPWAPPAAPDLAGRAAVSQDAEAEEVGHAHVATASFLAARLAPSGGFAIALAGGLALARLSARNGWRAGYGASLAATLQTVAIIGPLRFQIPFTQAVSAPMVGRQDAAGVAPWLQVVCCAAIRLTLAIAALSFHIWVILGGLDAYADAYDGLLGWLPLVPEGETAAVSLAVGSVVLWTIAGSIIQVLVYRRGLRDWPEDAEPSGATGPADPGPARTRTGRGPRFDPRAVALSAIVAFGVLIASHDWIVLASVTGWLALAWLLARADPEPLKPGLILAAILGVSVLFAGLIGKQDAAVMFERTGRAMLLVLVATWLRAAAGEAGLREVFRRSLHRLRRVPAVAEADVILNDLGNERGLVTSGKALMQGVKELEQVDVVPLAKVVLAWSAEETRSYRKPPPTERIPLSTRVPDGLLVLAVLAAAGALAAPVM